MQHPVYSDSPSARLRTDSIWETHMMVHLYRQGRRTISNVQITIVTGTPIKAGGNRKLIWQDFCHIIPSNDKHTMIELVIWEVNENARFKTPCKHIGGLDNMVLPLLHDENNFYM
jgi:hypothetical protein